MTTWGQFYSEIEFSDLVAKVIWFNSVMTAKNWVVTKMVAIRALGVPEEISIEFNRRDIAHEDDLLEQANFNAFLILLRVGH